MRRVLWWGLVATVVAGVVGVLRQRGEATAVARGELPRATAAADVPARVTYGWLGRRLAGWVPGPPATPRDRAVAMAWAAPLTAVGFALALASGRWPQWSREQACFVVEGMRGPSAWALRSVGASANTIGHVILSRQEPMSAALLAHETVHVRQAERFGPLLFPLYVWLGARYGYRDNPFERAARLGARAAVTPEP